MNPNNKVDVDGSRPCSVEGRCLHIVGINEVENRDSTLALSVGTCFSLASFTPGFPASVKLRLGRNEEVSSYGPHPGTIAIRIRIRKNDAVVSAATVTAT